MENLIIISTLISLYIQCTESVLRGPNVCYHYDVGRHCCDGFIEANGFCILNKKHDLGSDHTIKTADLSNLQNQPNNGKKLTFQGKPLIRSHNKLDEDGRPLGVLYSHSAAESNKYPSLGTNLVYNQNEEPYVDETVSEDYGKPVDMEIIRRNLNANSNTSVLGKKPSAPQLRFQNAPNPVRQWDWETNSWKKHESSNQVAVGRINKNFFKATKIAGINDNYYDQQNDEKEVDELKQRQPITIPLRPQSTTRKPLQSNTPTTEDMENRIYFTTKSVQFIPKYNAPLSREEPSPELKPIMFPACQQGFTSVQSQDGTIFCYPLSGLASVPQSVQERAPLRGDGALTCPPGYNFRSSDFGDACVPFGWQPCSSASSCKNAEQPIVNPIASIDCRTIDGQKSLCIDTLQQKADDCSSQNCGDQMGCGDTKCSTADEECTDEDCGEQSNNDCDSQGCLENQQSCKGLDCGDNSAECDSTQSGGGPCVAALSQGMNCLNGGTATGNGLCICPPGFVGENCAEDVDECALDDAPCSYECLNTYGSYKCFCPAGSVLAADGETCVLITCPKCMHGGYCNQQTNKCICPAGFTGDRCESDIDECKSGRCSHQCRNTFGSYKCLCKQGYTLLGDGHTCEDWRCRPNCVNGGVCERNRCICPDGFSGIICQFNNKLK